MDCYSAYGLTISSELPMPDLLASGQGNGANVKIVLSPPSPASTIDASTIQCVTASQSSAHLSWSAVGDLVVENGNRILVRPAPDVDDEALGLFVAGAGLGVLLHQRGFLVLHGSAVRIDDSIVGFLGAKGWGKSTTAMALKRRGHTVTADEHLVVDMDGVEPMVLPGSSPLKLWADALCHAACEPESALPVRRGLNKYYAGGPSLPSTQSPLRHIYLLDGGPELSVEPVAPAQAFFGIVPHLYVSRFGSAFLHSTDCAAAFRQLTRLIGMIPISRLIRRRDLTELDDIAEIVESNARS